MRIAFILAKFPNFPLERSNFPDQNIPETSQTFPEHFFYPDLLNLQTNVFWYFTQSDTQKMPRKCYIPGCNSNSGKFAHYTPVFSFPKEEYRRQKWFNIVRNEFPFITETDPGVNACVCVHHFESNLVEKQPQLVSSICNFWPALTLSTLRNHQFRVSNTHQWNSDC